MRLIEALRPLARVVLVGLCCAGTGGCCHTRIVSQKQAFFERNPGARQHYVEFEETSLECLKRWLDEAQFGTKLLISSVEEQLGDCEGIRRYLSEVRRRLAEDYEGKRAVLKAIESNFDPEKDGLFFYSYCSFTGQEQGWAILRNGRMRKKIVLATTFGRPAKEYEDDQ